MKCVKIENARKLVPTSIDAPRAKDGNVLIDVKKCGICGSDIHYWDLGAPKGLVMGHEFCGVVTNPGSRTDLKVGDRVTALPISPCGECEPCRTGNPQYCAKTWDNAVGLSLTYPGAYAEKTALRADLVYRVPSNITDAEVAMVEPSAVALHAVNLANLKIGSKVLVIGAGIIGQLTAMFAKMNGASYVAVSEANPKRGEKAVKLGVADEYFYALDQNWAKNVRKECPEGYDYVFDCCGNSPAVSSGIMAAKQGGTMVLVGVSMESITIPSILVVTKEMTLKGAIAYTPKEFKQCIDLMADRKIDTLKFVDDIVGLEGVQHAFERLTSGDDNAIMILIDPSL